MSSVEISAGDPRDPAAAKLLRSSHDLMRSLFPSESNHFLSIDDLCAPSIRFFLAKVGGETLGCGALAIYDSYGEVKSVFTDPAGRGQGIAAKLMAEIENVARSEGLELLKLETGDLLADAHRLYHRLGFQLCGPFGDYQEDPNSLFMEKRLS